MEIDGFVFVVLRGCASFARPDVASIK